MSKTGNTAQSKNNIKSKKSLYFFKYLFSPVECLDLAPVKVDDWVYTVSSTQLNTGIGELFDSYYECFPTL